MRGILAASCVALAGCGAGAQPPEPASRPQGTPVEEQVHLPRRALDTSERRCLDELRAVDGGVALACVAITFENAMSSAFNLISATFWIDDQSVLERSYKAGDDLRDAKSFEVLRGKLAPGDHELRIELSYMGAGFGLFSFSPYRFRVRSRHAFHVEPNRAYELRVVAHERGGVTTPIEERPSIRYEEGALDDVRAP